MTDTSTDLTHPDAKKHLASCGIQGSMSGRRVGTRYANDPWAVRAIMQEPWFRFRNDDCERFCRITWQAGENLPADALLKPTKTKDGPNTCASGQDLHKIFGQCPIYQRERHEVKGFDAYLVRFDDSELFQWFAATGDGYRYPFGRVLTLTELGKRALATRA